jgi:putative transposase
MKRTRQLPLDFRPHGGPRKGAGRKPAGDKALVSHLARPQFEKPTPAHITLRIDKSVPSLRSSLRFAVVRKCFARSRGRFGLRLVEFTVMSNHLHLVVEADDSKSLSRGLQGLCISLAKSLNFALARSGRIFADHYHSHLLRTPTEVANALEYVQDNAEHHYGESGLDWFSSQNPELRELLARPVTWLLNVGWTRARPKAHSRAHAHE